MRDVHPSNTQWKDHLDTGPTNPTPQRLQICSETEQSPLKYQSTNWRMNTESKSLLYSSEIAQNTGLSTNLNFPPSDSS